MHNHRRILLKGISPGYCKTEIRRIAKDYIGGDLNNPELSPLVSNDPILQQQCRTRGYMTIPIGGELRNVICGGTADHEGDELKEETLQCPICHNSYCQRHLSEHLDEPIYTTPRGREIRVDNPEIYVGMPDADLRTEMSSWDNAELNRAFRKVESIVKGMEEGGPGSGHHGHAGVPGSRGGSAPSGTAPKITGSKEFQAKMQSALDRMPKQYRDKIVVKNIVEDDTQRSIAHTDPTTGTITINMDKIDDFANSDSQQHFIGESPDQYEQNYIPSLLVHENDHACCEQWAQKVFGGADSNPPSEVDFDKAVEGSEGQAYDVQVQYLNDIGDSKQAAYVQKVKIVNVYGQMQGAHTMYVFKDPTLVDPNWDSNTASQAAAAEAVYTAAAHSEEGQEQTSSNPMLDMCGNPDDMLNVLNQQFQRGK